MCCNLPEVTTHFSSLTAINGSASVCYCLISPTMKRFRCAVWHWHWLRAELALNCTTLSSLQQFGMKKKTKNPSCSWAVASKLTAPFYVMLLYLYVFSKRDSSIAVVSAPSVRRALLGTAFYCGAGSQCRLAWQITLKRFPPTSQSKNLCASTVSCVHLIRQ